MERSKIRLLVLDVDGVLTDGGMYYTESGDQFKKFDAKDGMGIKLAIQNGVKVAFLSSGTNETIIRNRALTLGVDLVHAGPDQKFGILSGWCKELGIALEEVAFIGDDINDLECIYKVGYSACPANAVISIRKAARVVLNNKGGEGCVREFIDENILAI